MREASAPGTAAAGKATSAGTPASLLPSIRQ